MKRPMERFGWTRRGNDNEVYTKETKIITFENDGVIIADNVRNIDLSFEELQAIYETAKQIREENKYDK